MELEPGKRYEFTGTLTPATPAAAAAPRMPGWVYRGGIGLAMLAALWLIGQQDKAAPAGTPSPTATTQPADVRPGQEAHK